MPTIADGIAVKTPGEITFKIIQHYLDDIFTVDEDEIANAILLLLERAKVISEGAGAAPLAAILNRMNNIRNKKIVALVSGGNIDVNMLSRIIDKGLVKVEGKYSSILLFQIGLGPLAICLSLWPKLVPMCCPLSTTVQPKIFLLDMLKLN